MQLSQLQTEFLNYILNNKQDIQLNIKNNIGLDIYHQAYRTRLETALADNYPVLKIFLGNQNFSKLSQDYINIYISDNFSIRYYGHKLADYFRQDEFFPEFSFLAELAEFEWTMSLIYDSASSAVINFSEIAKISPTAWSNMRLQLKPSVARINLSYNAVEIWRAIIDEQNIIPEPKKQSSAPWLLWRQGLTSRYCELPPEEAWAIDGMMNQLNFGEICAGLCQWVDEEKAGPLAAFFLKNWLSAELIVKVIT